ncbi:GspE/PulE family protein [Chryseolinea soli]|uniref:Type II/IV secretion system protein n=1 Tax=Chryseolinea soli TaxID=2321403 RepID=A0A385SFN3_9BACT|nr:GspE/PulE family protein [Chryseolinea soli]AYB29206.1 type II/IV secretion system protein [Chryseolinea soli]
MTGELILDPQTKKYISSEIAWTYRVLPGKFDNQSLEVYVDENVFEKRHRDELEIVLGYALNVIPRNPAEIEEALTKFYLRETGNRPRESRVFEISDRNFLDQLLKEARLLGSSDIHIEIYDQKCRIRLRIDGKLIEKIRINKKDYPALINKVKIMAGLDISEKRLPQDGRIFFQNSEMKFDIRVSVLPTLYGEKIVLRILGHSATSVDIEQLGFSALDMSRYKESIRKPNGIILISGPTGSGKTTTLYGTLKVLNKETDNILTIEDPIEYTLEGINQVQVKEEIGLTFSAALRTFLRQDPDIIMVGEIRDAETASLAIRAALTGHLVLSTIHTNSAWGTISRLIDMNVPPFLLSNTLNASIAQRLIRLLCPVCKERMEAKDAIFPSGFKKRHLVKEHYVSKGCKECLYTGYKGRKAIYEVIQIDADVADLIVSNAKDVAANFKSKEVKNLQESALEILIKGETSVEEIYPLLLNDQY